MKNLTVKINWTFLLLLILISCDNGEGEKTHTDITGKWKFTSPSYSGEFNIVKSLNGNFTVEAGTSFKINGQTYQHTYGHDLDLQSGLEIEFIWLQGDEGYLVLDELFYTGDFKKMTSTLQYIVTCSSCIQESTNEDVTITRK